MKDFFRKRICLNPSKNCASQNFLVITTSGGGGHLQAAAAKKNEIHHLYKATKIFEKNIVESAGGKLLGKFMIDVVWNNAQRKGSVKALNICAYSIPIFDILFWIPVFFQIFSMLKNHDIDHVTDTQPMATSAIASATYLYKKLSGKEIFIEKVLTELPTTKSRHYLRPIRKLSTKKRNLLRLLTTHPLLGHHANEEDFWFNEAGLRLDQVLYKTLPIRPAFIDTKLALDQQLQLHISLKNSHEHSLLHHLLQDKATFEHDFFTLSINKDAQVVTMMLGSQPLQEASINYVKNFIRFVKDTFSSQEYWFFIFCSDKKFEPIPLQQRIYSLITSWEDFPKNLTIVPMSPQTDAVIAPLYARSQATITKAGGITAMELLHTAQGKIWIHYENPPVFVEKIRKWFPRANKGMPKWEYGNVLYLQEKKHASFVNTNSFYLNCCEYFSSNSNFHLPQEQKQNLSTILSSHEA